MDGDLERTIESLFSPKIKTRNDVLDHLENSLDSQNFTKNIDKKSAASLINGLYSSIEVDLTLLRSGKGSSSAIESRLVKASRSIRKFLQNRGPKLKNNQISKIMGRILSTFETIHYRPMSLEFAKSLSFLTSKTLYILSMRDPDYTSIVKSLIRILNKEFQRHEASNGDNIICAVLEALHNTISSFALSSPRSSLFAKSNDLLISLVEMLTKFIERFQKSSLNMVLAFKMANFIIINGCLESVKLVHRLILKFMKVLPCLQLYNYSSLKDIVLVFLNLSGDYIISYHRVPRQSQSENIAELDDLKTIKTMIVEIINLIDLQLINSKDHEYDLHIKSINFYDSAIHHNISHWFKLDFIFLSPKQKNQPFHSDQRAWLSRVVTAKLVAIYFEILKMNENQDDEEESQQKPMLKKRKVVHNSFFGKMNGGAITDTDFNLVEVLNQSSSFMNFLSLLLKVNKEVIGCQILLFYLSMKPRLDILNDNSLLNVVEAIFCKLDDTKLSGWLLLASKVILEYLLVQDISRIETCYGFKGLEKLLKICLQSLNNSTYGSVCCSTAITILNYFEAKDYMKLKLANDSILNQIVYSMIDLAEIRGPATVNNHSFMFWFKLYASFGNHSKIGNIISEKVLLWLLGKFDRMVSTLNDNQNSILGTFLVWILGGQGITVTNDQLYGTDGSFYDFKTYSRSFMNYCVLWKSSEEFRDRLALNFVSAYQPGDSLSVGPLQKSSNSQELVDQLLLTWFKSLDEISTGTQLEPSASSKGDNSTISTVLALQLLDVYILKLDDTVLKGSKHNIEFKLESVLQERLCEASALSLLNNFSLLNSYCSQKTEIHKTRKVNLLKFINLRKLVFNTLQLLKNGESETIEGSRSMRYHSPSPLPSEDPDGFGAVRRHRGDLEFSDTEINHFKLAELYSKTSLQDQLFLFVADIINSSDQSENAIAEDFKDSVDFLMLLTPSQFIDCCGSYFKILSTTERHKLPMGKKLVRLIGNKLLASDHFETNEIAICFACRLLSIITYEYYKFEKDYNDVLKYLLELQKSKFLNTADSLKEFQALLLLLIPEVFNLQPGTDEGIISPLFKVDLGTHITVAFDNHEANFLRLNLANEYSKFFERATCEIITASYNKIYKVFDLPQQSSECFFTFAYFLASSTKNSKYTTSYYLFNVTEFISFHHLEDYIVMCFDLTVKKLGLKNRNELFCQFRLEILQFWHQSKSQMTEFPFALFGYSSEKEFISRNYQYIVPVIFSGKRSGNSEDMLNYIVSSTGKEAKKLVFECLPTIVCLAFTQNGIKNDVFKGVSSCVGSDQVKSVFRKWLSDIILSVIIFCNLSDRKALSIVFKSANEDDGLQEFKIRDTNSLIPLEAPVIGIAPKTAKALIKVLLENFYKGDNFWKSSTIFFLTTNILRLLNDALSIDDKLSNLRKLNVILSYTMAESYSPEILKAVIYGLLPYVFDYNLKDEVSYIMLKALVGGSKLLVNCDLVIFKLVTALAGEILETGNRVEALERWFIKFYNELSDDTEIINLVLRQLVSILKNENWQLTAPQLTMIIKKCYNEKGYAQWLEEFVPILFLSNDNDFSLIIDSVSPDYTLATFLYHMKRKKGSSPKFLRWRANYLGCFYSETGVGFEVAKPRKNLSWLKSAFEKKSVHYVMSFLFKDLKTWVDENISKFDKKQLLMQDTLRVFFSIHLQDQDIFSKVCSFNEIFGEYENCIVPLDFSVFAVQHPMELEYHSMDLARFVETDYFVSLFTADFDKWCTELCLSLIDGLSGNAVYLRPLAVLFKNSPDFSKKFLPNLVVFFLDQTPQKNVTLISKLVEKYLCLDEACMCQESMELFVDLCLRLRIGSKYNDKKFIQAFQNRFSERVFLLACRLELWIIALMFYESFKGDFNNLESVLSFEETEKLLDKAYHCIDAEDIKYSLSVKPTLEYAIAAINEDSDSMKKVMINSAIFESLYNSNNLISSKSIVNSVEGCGLSGISNLMNDYFNDKNNDDIEFDSSYRWAWRLGKWDLPDSETRSYNSTIYKKLKSLKQDKLTMENDKILEEALQMCDRLSTDHERNYKNKSMNSDSSKLLGFLWNVESSLKMDKPYIKGIHKLQINSDSWLFSNDFSRYEDFLEAKQVALGLQYQQVNFGKPGIHSFKIALMRIIELFTYNNLACLNNEPQKATNSIMKMDKILKDDMRYDEDDKSITSIIRDATIISQFAIATTLWNQKETQIPIVMLKKLRSEVSDSQYSEIALKNEIVSKDLLESLLVEWLFESKQETPSSIMKEYIQTFDSTETGAHTTKLCHTFAKFCDNQLKLSNIDEELSRYSKNIKSMSNDLKEARSHKNSEMSRYSNKLKSQLLADDTYYKSLMEAKENFINLSVKFYVNSILTGDGAFDSDVDRLCALWLKYSDSDMVNLEIERLVSDKRFSYHKFIPWVSQLSSRLATDDSLFQRCLKKVLINSSLKHPYHTLFILKSLRLQHDYNKNPDAIMKSRITAANELWIELFNHSNQFNRKYLMPIDQFCNNSVGLANYEVTKDQKGLLLKNLNIGKFWTEKLPNLGVPLPTREIVIRKDADYENCPVIKRVSSQVDIAPTGISRPKIVVFEETDGSIGRALFKGNTDDLRQDAIMEQVFEKVNVLLMKDKEAGKRKLQMRTYKVVPMGPQAGMIQFVPDCKSFFDIVAPYHAKYDKLSHRDLAKRLMNWEKLPVNQRVINYVHKIDNVIKPVFREFFFRGFLNPYDWFDKRLNYSKGTAACSMVGHMLGLGDRHGNNILIDKTSGEPIHIDLGVAFDQGTLLAIPETVPFRLTKDIVDGFGVSGVEGVFRKSSEHVFRVLRDQKDQIDGILNILKWDPLYMWSISPLRKKRLAEVGNLHNIKQDIGGLEASRAVAGVQSKLVAQGLSVEAAVRSLIQEASDVKNLALLYQGWCPFY
ncbi:DNA-binding protein kinase [Saccharomycopsis crataegensis]|uniref:Serine/threonine-protein kinase Tel1 n=1 Tax=Saccharomycopsis crataegensis TaxID=43959 RepID=A0AAV5QMD7_9ASCO|nr:DNA-binding protein kinase [Saccharomycopsis crataegensis]